MAFFNAETGRFLFEDGLCLAGGMTAQELNSRFHTPSRDELLLCMGAHPVRGGCLALLCRVDSLGLAQITLEVESVNGRDDAGADRQRSFLFQALGFKDPCPDTRQNVLIGCPSGRLLLYTDSYTGGAAARFLMNRPDAPAEE